MWELIKVFKALSDETRMRMLHLLMDGELCKPWEYRRLGPPETWASSGMPGCSKTGVTDSGYTTP